MTEYLIARILVRDKIEESPYLQPLLVSFLFTNDSTKQLNDFTKATENGAVQTHALPSVSMKKLARMRARTRAKIQNLNKQISIYSEPIPEIKAKLKTYRRDATEAKKTNKKKWRTATFAVRRLNRTLASKKRFIKIKQGKIKKLEEELKQAQAAIIQAPQEEEGKIQSVSATLAQPVDREKVTDAELKEEMKNIIETERKELALRTTTGGNVNATVQITRSGPRAARQTTAEPIDSLQTVGNTLMKTKRPHQTSTGSTPRPSNCVTKIIRT